MIIAENIIKNVEQQFYDLMTIEKNKKIKIKTFFEDFYKTFKGKKEINANLIVTKNNIQINFTYSFINFLITLNSNGNSSIKSSVFNKSINHPIIQWLVKPISFNNLLEIIPKEFSKQMITKSNSIQILLENNQDSYEIIFYLENNIIKNLVILINKKNRIIISWN